MLTAEMQCWPKLLQHVSSSWTKMAAKLSGRVLLTREKFPKAVADLDLVLLEFR